MSDTIERLRKQLDEAEENLRLIQEREAQYVMDTDIPLQLIKDARRLEAEIPNLRARLTELAEAQLDADMDQLRARQDEDGQTRREMRESQREREPHKAPSPDGIIWERDGKEMVRVPAGRFLYGEEKEECKLPGFWIDKTPVTNAEYARFAAATGHKPPRSWKGNAPPEGMSDHPVIHITWHDAKAYAEWAGKLLPTEEEWEKAARGTDGREYPWGDWEEGRCNTSEAGIGRTTPVGQYSPDGDSPYGCVDMTGNVWDWTSSPWERGRHLRVVRGGSWYYDRSRARCAFRYWYFRDPSYGYYGFRCVSPGPWPWERFL